MSPYFSALITYMFLLAILTGFDYRDGSSEIVFTIGLPLAGAAVAYVIAARVKEGRLKPE